MESLEETGGNYDDSLLDPFEDTGGNYEAATAAGWAEADWKRLLDEVGLPGPEVKLDEIVEAEDGGQPFEEIVDGPPPAASSGSGGCGGCDGDSLQNKRRRECF